MNEEIEKPNLEKLLSDKEREDYLFVKDRIKGLKKTREDIDGMNLEKIWKEADRDYIPHTLKKKGKRVIATDEEKGWRGALVELGKSDDWQADASQPNLFTKIQIALSILIDRNPEAVMNPSSKKYEANNLLIKNLYNLNWERAKSKQQLKLFTLNLSKYGWACGRTYPRLIKRKVKNLVSYDQENPEKSVWEDKEVVEYNDVYRENLDPYTTWIDDMAKPNDEYSIRDWAFKKVYSKDIFDEEFGKYKLSEYVKPVGSIEDDKTQRKYQEKDLIDVYFYENVIKDLKMVIANDIPFIIEPLPISDTEGHKKLSLWQTYWNLRSSECPYGVGIYEVIKSNKKLLDRIRNMTIDQLTLSIYKMFFFQGTNTLTETGDIKLSPGKGKQVLDPKNIKWIDIAGPGAEAWKGIEMLKDDVDEDSAITKPLSGEITGKTAFEIAQAKEAALKRLKIPLDNISEALEQDAYITISLVQSLYSIPEVYKIADTQQIEDYLKEIKSDPNLYNRTETGEFEAKVYRELQMGIEQDEKGNLTETEDTRFFRIKPSGLKWNGIIKVKGQSVLMISKELQKAMDLEFNNVIWPMLHDNPAIALKPAKQLCKIYDKDPKDWLPDEWLQEKNKDSLFIQQPQQIQGQEQGQPQGQPQMPQQGAKPPNMIQKMAGQIRKALPFGR